ncbi:hypothetical protein AB0I81_10680 [Nonomuraea sp. NPDC050404]|uniref:hypothetical protein n=1 Tax=Nonomuraea sp. NPDC050404 TaxID=3155783 RepID=UPI0033E13164
MLRRLLLAVAAWLITVLAAMGAGVAVIGFLGESLTGPSRNIMSAEQVLRALTEATPRLRPLPSESASRSRTPSSPSPSKPPVSRKTSRRSAPPAGPRMITKRVTTSGGTVIARCERSRVTLRSLSPAQGYQIGAVEPGPGAGAVARFVTAETEVRIDIRCSASGPVHVTRASERADRLGEPAPVRTPDRGDAPPDREPQDRTGPER